MRRSSGINFDKSDVLYIPRIFTELSTKRVLVLERIEGIRINEFQKLDEAGFDRREIALKGAAAFFKMVLQDGLFHADPHPGNIFVLPDGRLGLVDFGIMGRVTEENMELFADIFVALAEHDYDALVRQYVNLGFLSEGSVDIEKIRTRDERGPCRIPRTLLRHAGEADRLRRLHRPRHSSSSPLQTEAAVEPVPHGQGAHHA